MAITWESIKLATASDDAMTKLTSIIVFGFPDFGHELPLALQEYFQFHDHLDTSGSVILYKDCIVIQPSL